jgi:SPP1 gp7 family putative phage head morphogenesis protein
LTIHPCQLHTLAYDRKQPRPNRKAKAAKSVWEQARKAERNYAIRLRKVAAEIGHIVKSFDLTDPSSIGRIDAALKKYAGVVELWAPSAGAQMVVEVGARDRDAWRKSSTEIGRGIAREMATAPVGQVTRDALAEQVRLISSLPIEAAQRVHNLAIQGLSTGARASDIAEEIMRTGEVTKSRATLIARTETGRVSTEFTKARAEHVGSTTYLWRTARDGDVRASHKAMEGKQVDWNRPPTLDGMTGHAGSLPNCRCFCQPQFNDFD